MSDVPSFPLDPELPAAGLCPWKGERHALVANPDEPLSFALLRMVVHGYSQVPVVADGKVLGLIDETGALQVLLRSPEWLEKPVRWVMAPPPPVVRSETPARVVIDHLLAGAAVVVIEDARGPWLVTRSDLLRGFLTPDEPEYSI